MRVVITALLILSAAAVLGACGGQERSTSRKRTGGCKADTFPLESCATVSCDDSSSPVRISILSVERADDSVYREAAASLAAVLDTLGVRLCAPPNLVVISEGPCWPRYRIDFRVDREAGKDLGRIRSLLEAGTLAGLKPAAERPPGYGLFFVQAAVGSSDRWTLWYGSRR